jgi:hypothetical protein
VPLPFNVFYLDTGMTLQKSNSVTLTVTPNNDGCTFCFGQKDDGAFDGFVFKVNRPAGNNDWFNNKHGTISPASGVSLLTGVNVATWDVCGGLGSTYEEVGIYPANLFLSSAGALPDLANPIATVGGLPVAGAQDWGYPAHFADTADVVPVPFINDHAAVNWNDALFEARGTDPAKNCAERATFSPPGPLGCRSLWSPGDPPRSRVHKG